MNKSHAEEAKKNFIKHIKDFNSDSKECTLTNGCCLYMAQDLGDDGVLAGCAIHTSVIEIKQSVNAGFVSYDEIRNIHLLFAPHHDHGLVFLDAIINNNWEIYNKLLTNRTNLLDNSNKDGLDGSPIYKALIIDHFEKQLSRKDSYV